MRRRAILGAVLATAMLSGAGSAGAQAPAPLYGGQLLYSTVTVAPGEIKTWTVTCPPGHVLLSPWIAPPPKRVTVTERIIVTSTTATSFRAVSQATAPVQVTVAVTCLKVRRVSGGKKARLRLSYTVTRPVRVRIQPGATRTVRVTCPAGTTPVGPSIDVAPVTSPRVDRPARMVDIPALIRTVARDRAAEIGLHNLDDVLRQPTIRVRCGTLVDEDGNRSELRVLTRAATGQVAAGQQVVLQAPCPAGSLPIGVDRIADASIAALPFPRGLDALDIVTAAPAATGRQRVRTRCLRLDQGPPAGFRRRGMPPPPFESGPLEDRPADTTPGGGPPPGTQPGAAGTGSFADVPGFPLERAFTFVFNQPGTGLRIRTPGHQITNFLAPGGMGCTTPESEMLECIGAITSGAPVSGRVALFPAAAPGDQVQIVLLTEIGPTNPFAAPLIP